MRFATVMLCLCGIAWAHGGSFRPPPRQGPRDPVRTPPRPGAPTTPGVGTPTTALTPWEFWWSHNRDRYLLLRDRLARRTVVTGPRALKDTFDREALRVKLRPILLEALRDRDAAVRGAAAIALGKFGARKALPQIVEMHARDKSKEVREAAVMALMLLRDPAAIPVLGKIATSDKESRRMRGLAVLGLGLLGETDFLEFVLKARTGKLGSNSDRRELQSCAALALGFTGKETAVATLSKIAFDKNMHRHVRGYAASSLGRLGHPIAVPDVLKLIRDRDQLDQARQGAAISAGALVRPTEAPLVGILTKTAAHDKDMGVRQLLTMSLGRIGGEDAALYLAKVVRSRDYRMRGYGMLAFGISGHKDAGSLLALQFPKLKNSSDRAACALGIGLADHRVAAPALRKEAERANPAFLHHALLALGLLNDQESLPLLRKTLEKSRDPLVRRDGAIALALILRAGAVPELLKLLDKTKTLYARASIAHALGLVGTEKAVDPLLAIYRDRKKQSEERALAIAALGRMGDPESIPVLSQFAFDLHPYVTSEAVTEIVTIL